MILISQQAKTTMTSPIPSRTNKTLNIELVAFSYSTLLRYARERVLKKKPDLTVLSRSKMSAEIVLY